MFNVVGDHNTIYYTIGTVRVDCRTVWSAGFTKVQIQPVQCQGSGEDNVQGGKIVAEALVIVPSADYLYPADKLAYLLRELVKPR